MGSHLFSLPPELIYKITKHLPRKDLVTFSVLSSATRQLIFPSLFHHVRLRGDMKPACDALNRAGEKFKDAIEDIAIDMPLTLKNGTFDPDAPPVPICVFQTLETLPNLFTLNFSDYTTRIRFCDLPLLLPIAQKTQLRYLSFETVDGSVASGPRVAGPADLETASIKWLVSDDPQDQNSSAAHLYEFLRPSLGTLSRLEIYHNDAKAPSGDPRFLDFRQFGPPCVSLRSLHYTTFSRDPKALEAVAEMFPNLSDLNITFEGDYPGKWAKWTDEFLKPLSSLSRLTHLTIAVDLEISADDELDGDHDFAWYRRCFFRRLNVSEDIMKVCPQLERCDWIHLGIDSEGNNQNHDFVIQEEDGKRVLKPVMQWWMAKPYEEMHEGPLPDDMVKENAYWENFPGVLD